MPVEVEYASEFRYRNPPIDRNTIVVAMTQSGETADTLAALRESKRKGHPTLALCNVVGSSIAREADGGATCTPGRRSASPAPRLSPIRSRCSRCWPSTSAACATSPAPGRPHDRGVA